MFCPDPYLKYLSSFGYNVVLLPRKDLTPLQVLATSNGNLSRLGPLEGLLVTGSHIPLPPIKADIEAAAISLQRTGELKVGLGLAVMSTFLGALGASKIGVDTQYKAASKLAFEFANVLEDSVELIALDQYLLDADVNSFSHHVARMLEADEIYVTTATIKSTGFTVEAKKSDGSVLELHVPEIQGLIEGEVHVSGTSETTTKVTYQGSKPLVFGFKAIRLFYRDGKYEAYTEVKPGVLGLKGTNEPRGPAKLEREMLKSQSAFLRLAG